MENEEEKVIQSRPPAYASDKVLLDAFAGEVVKQSERFDELNLALLKFELGIPGLFVTALKLFPQDPIQTASKGFLVAALVFWMIALGITLCGIKPKKYDQVLRDVVHSSSPGPSPTGKLTIEEFYQQATQSKAWYFKWSVIAFFLGVLMAGTSILIL